MYIFKSKDFWVGKHLYSSMCIVLVTSCSLCNSKILFKGCENMFIKTVYNVKESRYVPVDWCMSKEECRVGRYHERTLEEGVSSVLEEFDCFDFVGVHNTYESLMADVLDYSLENEDCDFDFVDIDNELSAKLDNQEAACFIFCDGTGESCVFDFEQFNMIAEWDIEMHLKSVFGDDIDSEDIVDVSDVFFDLFDEEELDVEGCDDVCEYLFKHYDLFNCVDFRSFVRF